MKVKVWLILLIGASIHATSQSYQTFNDSLAEGWNVKTISIHSFGGESKLLVSYSNPELNLIYPAIATYRNKKFIVEKVINNQSCNNIYSPVERPDGRLLLPTTIIQESGQFYYNLLTLEKNGSAPKEINVFINPHQTLAGGIYELGKNKWVDLQTIQKRPDNPGQQAFYNVWFRFFEFPPDGKGRLNKEEVTIRSEFNEEVMSACKGNDSSFYILTKRYTKKDFSEYSGVLYCVNMKGVVKWEEDFGMNEYKTAILIPDKRGVLLVINTLWGNFLLPNSTMITVYDHSGKPKVNTVIEPFIVNCAVRNKAGQLVLGGSYYVVDSAFRQVVKKPKLVILNSADLKTVGTDQLTFMEGPDLELTMMQASTSSEINSILENKDGSFLLAGSVFRPEGVNNNKRNFHAMMLTANPKGKMDKKIW